MKPTTKEDKMTTRKEWLLAEHNIGKGGGKGRISEAGHALIAEAIEQGVVFSDLEPKAPKAPKVTKAATPKAPKVDRPKVDPKAVRVWAKDNGVEVSARGRLNSTVVDAYLEGTKDQKRPEAPTVVVGKDLRQEAPRRYPEGTTFEGNYEGKTVKVNERSACTGCGYSLSHHVCLAPNVVVGSGVCVDVTAIRN